MDWLEIEIHIFVHNNPTWRILVLTLVPLNVKELYAKRPPSISSYQTLVSEGVVDTSDEKPERPQVLEPELQHEISQQNQHPHHQELQVQERAAEDREKCSESREVGGLYGSGVQQSYSSCLN